jgi:amino acid transporter
MPSITSNARRSVERGLLLLLAGVLLLVLAGHLAVTYAGRSGQRAALQRSPDVAAIADWMTLAYIARAYGVPQQALLAAVPVTAPEARHRSLRNIARSQPNPSE